MRRLGAPTRSLIGLVLVSPAYAGARQDSVRISDRERTHRSARRTPREEAESTRLDMPDNVYGGRLVAVPSRDNC
jgi:hypothetical protein